MDLELCLISAWAEPEFKRFEAAECWVEEAVSSGKMMCPDVYKNEEDREIRKGKRKSSKGKREGDGAYMR